jgi:hypothetical protein
MPYQWCVVVVPLVLELYVCVRACVQTACVDFMNKAVLFSHCKLW